MRGLSNSSTFELKIFPKKKIYYFLQGKWGRKKQQTKLFNGREDFIIDLNILVFSSNVLSIDGLLRRSHVS